MAIKEEFILSHTECKNVEDVDTIDLTEMNLTGSFDLTGMNLPNLTDVYLGYNDFERIIIPQNINFLDITHNVSLKEIKIRDGVAVDVAYTEGVMNHSTRLPEDDYGSGPDEMQVEWKKDNGILLYSN